MRAAFKPFALVVFIARPAAMRSDRPSAPFVSRPTAMSNDPTSSRHDACVKKLDCVSRDDARDAAFALRHATEVAGMRHGGNVTLKLPADATFTTTNCAERFVEIPSTDNPDANSRPPAKIDAWSRG